MNHKTNIHQELSFLWKPILRDKADRTGSISGILEKPVVYHSLFWIGYFIFNTLRWGSYFDDYLYSFKSNLVEFPIHLILVYFNLYYLIKKFLPTSLSKYIFYLLFSVLIMSVVRILLTYGLVTTDV